MSHTTLPHFPRGFVLSKHSVDPPPTYKHGPLLDNFYVHPWTKIQVAGTADMFVIIIGQCIPTKITQSPFVAEYLLECLSRDEADFLRALDDYSGRHAILFGSSDDVRVVNDASSMRAVFYSTDGSVIASHAILVERALGGEIVESDLPFRYGFQGIRTPYSRTRILTSNTYYSMTENKVHRFWPVVAPEPQTIEDAADVLLSASTHALRTMAANKQFIAMGLTSGLDSRALLAIAKRAGISFRAYTYGGGPATVVERTVAKQLAEQFDFEHTVLPNWVKYPELRERVDEAHYSLHHAVWIGALRDYYPDADALALLGNTLEIGRGNTMVARRKGYAAPDTALNMAVLHHWRFGSKIYDQIEPYGETLYWDQAEALFQEYIDVTDLEFGLLDPFDQFYWEHRMSTWQGVAMGERDFYADPFIPFNSRRVFNAMLGVPDEDRHSNKTVYRMIEMVAPDLLQVPVNPTREDLKLEGQPP